MRGRDPSRPTKPKKTDWNVQFDQGCEQPGELRGYLTVVPEIRWIKHPDHQACFRNQTVGHYEEHRSDLEAVLAGARSGAGS